MGDPTPYYILAILLLAAGITVFAVFGGDTPDRARGRIARWWLVRFFTYRSGHGKHATT